jgi:FKBP-type peptidyl-prolyl cis-trans isomerase FkpA
MKYKNSFLFLVVAVAMFSSCDSQDFKKTPSGVDYKVISGNSKDSIAKPGDILKFDMVTKLNDSVLYSSYGKLPGYGKVPPDTFRMYSPVEAFSHVKTGDSLVTIVLYDSLDKKGMAGQMPPNSKKGDKLVTSFRIIRVFKEDSIAKADYEAEMVKDRPRQEKEKRDQTKKRYDEIKQQMDKEEAGWRQSGEIDKELKEMEAYLASKKINAQKTGKGTYVVIETPGTGPAPEAGDVVTVKYIGKKLNDSTFETNSYTFPIGRAQAIQGWDEGLMLFKQGGKGWLYIPGFLAYGENPPAGSPFRKFEPMKFEVELVEVRKIPN